MILFAIIVFGIVLLAGATVYFVFKPIIDDFFTVETDTDFERGEERDEP